MSVGAALGLGLPANAAAPVQLAFDPSPDPSVTGYALYYGEWNGATTKRLDVGSDTSARVLDLRAGVTHFFYVVAYTADGIESLPSNILYYVPVEMTRLRLSRHPSGDMQLVFNMAPNRQCRIEYTASLASPQWQTAGYARANWDGRVEFIDSGDNMEQMRFYRVVLLP